MNNGPCCSWYCRSAKLGPNGADHPGTCVGICNAMLYFVRAGASWRLLPRDFGPWQTVFHYFRVWTKLGLWEVIHDILRHTVREQAAKRPQPTAAILDSQTVRSSDQAGEGGYDAAKKTKGIQRPILVA